MTKVKSHRSAIVIIPPKSSWQQIQKWRQLYDKAYERWMPHINLIYPFYENSGNCFAKESEQLLKRLSVIPTFRILFSKHSIGEFVHGRSSTFWLKPLEPYVQHNIPTGIPDKENQKKPIHKVQEKKKKELPNNIKTTGSSTHPYTRPNITRPICHEIGFPPPVPVHMRNHIPSLDDLKSAVWQPGHTDEMPVAEVLKAGPGIDCLRYAVWTPDNVAFPMFSTNASTTQEIISANSDKTNECNKHIDIPSSSSSSSSSDSSSNSSDSDSTDEDSSHPTKDWDVAGQKKIRSSSAASDTKEKFIPRIHPAVLNLQAALQEIYPDLNELTAKSPNGFQPHLTLGQERVVAHRQSAIKDTVKEQWCDVEFDVKEIYLISRKDDLSPFKIIKSVPLSGFAVD